jgi:hypothetical protein
VRWALEEGEALWNPSSPLAGVLEDIVPFGSHQEWVARFHELDLERQPRATRVRKRMQDSRKAPRGTLPEPAAGPGGGIAGSQTISGAATGEAGPTPIDDALNSADRIVGALDTVIGLLELVGIEVAGSVVITVAGPLLMLATFVSGLAKADGQQRAAAKAMGVVFAYFAIKKAASREPPPPEVTPEDVEREVQGYHDLDALRDNRTQWRGPTPQFVLDEGEKEGIKLVLEALSSNLSKEATRAQNAYDRVILEARVESMNESEQERLRREEQLRAAYPVHWWATEIRRRTYAEFVKSIEGEALAVFQRFRQNSERGK